MNLGNLRGMLDAICGDDHSSSDHSSAYESCVAEPLSEEDSLPSLDDSCAVTANESEVPPSPPEIECPDPIWSFNEMLEALMQVDLSPAHTLPHLNEAQYDDGVADATETRPVVNLVPEPTLIEMPSALTILNALAPENSGEDAGAMAASDSLPSLSEMSAALPPPENGPKPPQCATGDEEVERVEERKRPVAPDSFSRWLQHFTEVGVEVQHTIDEYVNDATQKAARQRLKKAIVAKVNFASRRNLESDGVCVSTIAYFVNLLTHKPVKDATGENDLCLEPRNSAMYRFTEWTIFEQFISIVKHDVELLEWCITCAYYLAARIPQANEIFCAAILRNSSILKLDEAAIRSKLVYLAEAPPEAITNWLAGERAVLHLFIVVQARLDSKSCSDFGYLPRDVPRGQRLLRAVLEETLELAIAGKPVVLSTASILSTIIEAEHEVCRAGYGGSFKRFTQAEHLGKLKRVVGHDWRPLVAALCEKLSGDLKMSSVIKSRHEASLAFLSSAIQTKWRSNLRDGPRHDVANEVSIQQQQRRTQGPNRNGHRRMR